MPKLWTETIDAHRQAVAEAILDTTAALVSEHGLTSVTMSAIAERTGIGRATLYKYYPDVDSILMAWHERQIAQHLRHLVEIRDQSVGASARLEAVLTAYALIQTQHGGGQAAAALHQGDHVEGAHQQLHEFIRALIDDCAAAGDVRDDVAPDQLASYCVHALAAAVELPSDTAVRRLVAVILAGLRRPR